MISIVVFFSSISFFKSGNWDWFFFIFSVRLISIFGRCEFKYREIDRHIFIDVWIPNKNVLCFDLYKQFWVIKMMRFLFFISINSDRLTSIHIWMKLNCNIILMEQSVGSTSAYWLKVKSLFHLLFHKETILIRQFMVFLIWG